MTHHVENGAFKIEDPKGKDRFVFSDHCILTVKPDGKTCCRVDNGIKWPGGRKVALYVGEIDGVRCYATEREGKIHIILTRGVIKP